MNYREVSKIVVEETALEYVLGMLSKLDFWFDDVGTIYLDTTENDYVISALSLIPEVTFVDIHTTHKNMWGMLVYPESMPSDKLYLWENYVRVDGHSSLIYARDVLRERFPLGEEEILKSAALSFEYAKQVIRGRWPEAEKIISTSLGTFRKYQLLCGKERLASHIPNLGYPFNTF